MTCLECGWWKPICKCNGFSANPIVNNPTYDFVDINTTGKPVRIHSKRQWKQHLKKLNLTDDFQQSSKGKTYKSLTDTFEPTPREEIKKTIRDRFKETGVYDKLIRRK